MSQKNKVQDWVYILLALPSIAIVWFISNSYTPIHVFCMMACSDYGPSSEGLLVGIVVAFLYLIFILNMRNAATGKKTNIVKVIQNILKDDHNSK